jgi:hypothetical protein
MAQRIQLSRRAGWRKPEGAVVVSRPGRWGNPFNALEVGAAYPSLDERRDLVRTDGRGLVFPNYRNADGARGRREFTYPSHAEIREHLAGRDLACWCALDMPCHADVLLELANEEPR